eukprot:TRINITY_DN1197_c0_g1_i5.p1 TRINITY_DN1197_c0_g1~~TRINITY_DN1197_c0_g1_i5.p1  ORF type:complete len:400 (-),score=89.00 TRINITY_DN1197_c0_g1_i5:66-1175(-)
MREYLSVTTALALAGVWLCNMLLTGDASTFITGFGQGPQLPPPHAAGAHGQANAGMAQPLSTAREALGVNGLVGFGMGFGVLMALTRSAQSRAQVSRRAEGEIAVKEKASSELAFPTYLQNIPKSIATKATVEKILTLTPKEQWDNPPETSYLYNLKLWAECYGPGKATKMGWFDYVTMRLTVPGETEVEDAIEFQQFLDEYDSLVFQGKVPFAVPGPSGWWYTGAQIQWKGKEPFAGDQVQTLIENGGFGKQFLANMAFYRDGLKPWQRGLEIGMAHGYFLIGPFTSLGPLRNTPEAATVGLLCGCAIVGLVSIGGLIFGSTIKPTRFDKEGDKPAAGFIEMINWHAVGGLGGAGFAHALITVFGGAS